MLKGFTILALTTAILADVPLTKTILQKNKSKTDKTKTSDQLPASDETDILSDNVQVKTSNKVGIDFFMVGDYGYVQDVDASILTFNKMDEIVGNPKDSRDDIDFFMTMGDNIYPKDDTNPTDEEFDQIMRFFLDRDNIKDKTIYAVRGNHDCYFDLYRELELPKTYPKWFMPDLYYSRKFDIGEGKYLGVIFVDSCFALCSNYSFPNGTGG